MDGQPDESDAVRARLVGTLAAYASAHSELGRHFARRMRMHATDAAAMVEIIAAQGREVPLTPARLAERVGLTRGATSILLNRLQAAGHIQRRRGDQDRRTVTLHASVGVHENAADYFAPLQERVGAALARYSSDEIARAEHLIAELLAVHHEHLDQVDR